MNTLLFQMAKGGKSCAAGVLTRGGGDWHPRPPRPQENHRSQRKESHATVASRTVQENRRLHAQREEEGSATTTRIPAPANGAGAMDQFEWQMGFCDR